MGSVPFVDEKNMEHNVLITSYLFALQGDKHQTFDKQIYDSSHAYTTRLPRISIGGFFPLTGYDSGELPRGRSSFM